MNLATLSIDELDELIEQLESELERGIYTLSGKDYDNLRQEFDEAISEYDRRNGWPS
jgi:hypothetical protein